MAPESLHLAARAVQTVHALRQKQINTLATYSRITLYAYDILLNLDREKALIWKEGLRPASLLYYFVRYPVIAKQIYFVLSTPQIPNCDVWNRFTFTVSIVITRIAIVICFILRVYAVMERGKFFAGVLTVIGILSTALDIVQVKELSCTQASNPLAFVLTFISLIVFDAFATVLVSWKLVGTIKLRGGLRSLGSDTIIALIIRSGAIYFAVITGIQLGAVILYWLPQGLYSTVLNDYTLIMSSILISRFLLDLRSMTKVQYTDHQTLTLDFVHPNRATVMQDCLTTDNRRHQRSRWVSLVKDFESAEIHSYNLEFEDPSEENTRAVDSKREYDSMAVPLEVLASRARRVEERMAEKGGSE